MLTDTHAHLDFPDFAGRLDEIINASLAAGVHRIITVGIDRESCHRSLALAERYENIHAVVGLHPCNVLDPGAMEFLDELPSLARHPKVVAIGETGMDYHHLAGREGGEDRTADRTMKTAQDHAFRAQLDLAAGLGLNVVIHQRAAWDDTLEILRPYSGRVRGVFHCFGGSPGDAAKIASMGHLVSFTGIVTFKNALLVQQTAKMVADHGYMVETDCPYLAPVPFRGKTCEPAHVRITAEKISALRGETLEKVAADTERTAASFFRFSKEA